MTYCHRENRDHHHGVDGGSDACWPGNSRGDCFPSDQPGGQHGRRMRKQTGTTGLGGGKWNRLHHGRRACRLSLAVLQPNAAARSGRASVHGLSGGRDRGRERQHIFAGESRRQVHAIRHRLREGLQRSDRPCRSIGAKVSAFRTITMPIRSWTRISSLSGITAGFRAIASGFPSTRVAKGKGELRVDFGPRDLVDGGVSVSVGRSPGPDYERYTTSEQLYRLVTDPNGRVLLHRL